MQEGYWLDTCQSLVKTGIVSVRGIGIIQSRFEFDLLLLFRAIREEFHEEISPKPRRFEREKTRRGTIDLETEGLFLGCLATTDMKMWERGTEDLKNPG